MSEPNLNIELGKERGRQKGCEVIQSAPDLLLLDFDTKEAYDQFEAMQPLFIQFFPCDGIRTWLSSSHKAHHQHVEIKLSSPLPVQLRVALQAILGSDPRREFFSVLRLLNGTAEPSLLFKPKS